MASVASVAERRAMLKALGERPGREAVEDAQQALSRIDLQFEEDLEKLSYATPSSGVEVDEWRDSQEAELRESAENAKAPYKSLIQLDDLHQQYEDILKEEEDALDGRKHEDTTSLPVRQEEQDEVARLLQDALENKREELILKNYGMVHVPEIFGRITSLTVLDLSGNQLQTLPDSVAGLVNLEVLKIGSNQLTALPDSIGLLVSLKYLDISSNVLKHLPESLGRCSSLVELRANFNKLDYLPVSIGHQLGNVEKLELHLNNLSTLPPSICEMKSLKYLDLHFNKMRGLPLSIGNLRKLEYLDVSSNFNDLCTLPESMGDLVSLTYCDLSFNQIKELPDSFGRIETLTTLKLDGNPLIVPPMDVLEQGCKAVMEYMKQRWHASLEDENAHDGSGSTGGNVELSPWIPSWASSSWVGEWMGTISGNVSGLLGRTYSSKTTGFHEHKNPREDFLEQQL